MRRSTGWTGGQYSLYRAVLGVYLYSWFGPAAFAGISTGLTLLNLLGAVAGALLIAGWQDRAAAAISALLLIATQGPDPVLARPGLLGLVAALAAHVMIVASPYGSWAARGRPDPAGVWGLPAPVSRGAWIALVLLLLYQSLADPTGETIRWIRVALVVSTGLAATSPGLRPRAWAILLGAQLLWPLLAAGATLAGGLIMLLLLTFDPEWIGRVVSPVPEMLFYDGSCGLCHRTVRFILAEDPDGSGFRFAPLGGSAFQAAIGTAERAVLPDSIILRRHDGVLLVRSAAVLHIARRLGGVWRVLAEVTGLVPAGTLDVLYDWVAGVRKQLFPAPETTCPVVTAALRSRFDD